MSAIDRFDCNLVDEPIENIICSDLDIIDKPKDCLIISEFNCDSHIFEDTDDSNGNITLSNCFRPININATFPIEAISNTFTNSNANLNSKIKDVINSIVQLKDLIDQAQKLLHNFQNNVNVANTEPTG